MHSTVIALGIALLAACGSDEAGTPDAGTPDAPTPPTLTVAAMPATVTQGQEISIGVTVGNFTLVNPNPGPQPKPGEGHYHYYLDSNQNYTAAWTPTFAFRTGPATAVGPHTFRIVLVTSAHVEVTPTVEATATFTVQ